MQTEAPGWDGVLDPKTVAETVQEHARYALTTGEAADQAVHTARGKIYGALVNTVAEHLVKYLEQLNSGFDKAAEAYEQAVTKLPERFTSEDVVKFDPETFKAYSEAKAAAAEIQAAKAWLFSLVGKIPGQKYQAESVSTDFQILNPVVVKTYATVQLADTRGHDAAYKSIAPTILNAVRQGSTLRLALPSEAATDAEALGSQWWTGLRPDSGGKG